MKRLKSMSSLLVPVLIFALTISMTACGGSGDTPEADSLKPEKSMAAPQTPKAEAPRSKGDRAPGWKQAVYENYTFSLPEDWKGDGDTGIWCPNDQDLDMGRPKVSLHIGATPVMPGSGIEDGLKFYYGATPTTTGEVEKCGMKGKFVEVTVRGIKHMGLILIEDVGMTVLNFFDCQAPANEFGEQQETFKKILDSAGCR